MTGWHSTESLRRCAHNRLARLADFYPTPRLVTEFYRLFRGASISTMSRPQLHATIAWATCLNVLGYARRKLDHEAF